MNASVTATNVGWDKDRLWIDLTDGRTLGVPLAWFPRLLQATRAERGDVSISTRGLHWEHLDEDISIAALLEDYGDQSRKLPRSSAA